MHERKSTSRIKELLQTVRQKLSDPELPARHRTHDKAFTRDSKLSFPVLVFFTLKKSLKSLQSRLHELYWELQADAQISMVSSSALTHARAKLEASVFIELNQEAVLDLVYRPEDAESLKLWRGRRLLGIDSSKVRLPKSDALARRYGLVPSGNQHGLDEYPEARMSVLYDLLNQIGLDGRMESSKLGEEELARAHQAQIKEKDLIITDRGYAGYRWFAWLQAQGADFVCRCQKGSFSVVRELFEKNQAGRSVVGEIAPQKNIKSAIKEEGLPEVLQVRFVTVRLSTGELEVLGTSLLDEREYPTEEFGQLYWNRWGHETYYGTLKGAFDLENFSGKTVHAIEQDFQSMIFLANVQSLLIEPAEEELREKSKSLKNPIKVNRSVSLNAIKNHAMDLFLTAIPPEQVIRLLMKKFKQSTTAVRNQRKVPRLRPTANRSYSHQRRVRKFVF